MRISISGWRISLHPPRPSKLLVLDSELGSHYSQVLLEHFDHVRVDPRPGRSGSIVYLAPAVVLRTVLRLLKRDTGDRQWNWKKRLAYCYFAALVDLIDPRVVLSLRGGFTLWFSELARDFDGVEFLAVAPAQVHTSHLRGLRPSPARYFVYGEFDRAQLTRIGQAEDRVKAIGPLLGGYFQHAGWSSAQLRYDLCIPSQVVELALENSTRASENDRPTLLYAQRRLAEFASRFARERGLRVAIALRPQEPSGAAGGERRFFEQYMDCEYDIVESRPEEFSTYHAIAASRVVVTHCSTTGFEVLSWPKKVLFCEFKPYQPYQLPTMLAWSVHTDDYTMFAQTLQRLLDKDEAEYATEMESVARYFNGFRTATPPHVIISNLLRARMSCSGDSERAVRGGGRMASAKLTAS